MAVKKSASSRIIAPVILVGLIVILAGCSRSEQEVQAKVPPGGVLLTGAGATFPSVLYNRWFALYNHNHPNIVIKYAAVGSGEGVRRFIGKNVKEEEKVDFGASDAALTDQEIQEVARGAVLLPLTAGSLVLTYNVPELDRDLKLSRRAYAGIFLGTVKRWDDPLIAETNPDM